MIASAGAAGVAAGVLVADVAVVIVVAVVVVAVVIVVAAALPTLRKGTHRTCYQSGEDTAYTQGTRGNQTAVQHRWGEPDGATFSSESKKKKAHSLRGRANGSNEPHIVQRAVLRELLRSLVLAHRVAAVWMTTCGDHRCGAGRGVRLWYTAARRGPSWERNNALCVPKFVCQRQ